MNKNEVPAKKAYKTTALEIVSIVPAASRAQAKWITINAAKGAGYSVTFGDIRAIRAKEYDGWATTAKKQCWDETTVRLEIGRG